MPSLNFETMTTTTSTMYNLPELKKQQELENRTERSWNVKPPRLHSDHGVCNTRIFRLRHTDPLTYLEKRQAMQNALKNAGKLYLIISVCCSNYSVAWLTTDRRKRPQHHEDDAAVDEPSTKRQKPGKHTTRLLSRYIILTY